MMIKRCCPLVKPARVRGASKSQELAIKVMAELVAKRAEKCSVRRHLFANGGASPNANQRGLQIVITEEFHRAALAHAERPGSEDTNLRPLHFVEIRGNCQEVAAGVCNGGGLAGLQGGLDGLCPSDQALVFGYAETDVLVAAEKLPEQRCFPRRRISDHSIHL